MKVWKSIFCVFACVAIVGGARAASADGCDTANADYISATLALCTTHAYNANYYTNPSDAYGKQRVRDAVAMKTTVMTQQMYKQYEYLEATLRRLKTQLRKAVLTTNLQAAGADAGASSGGYSGASSSSGYRVNDQYVVVNGARNCMQNPGTDNGYSCLMSNIDSARREAQSGSVRNAFNQLAKDLQVANNWGYVSCVTDESNTNLGKKCSPASHVNGGKGDLVSCNAMAPSGTRARENILACADEMTTFITRAKNTPVTQAKKD